MCSARALRGSPASITSTERRDRPSTSAALRPAAPPPTTTTSYDSLMSMSAECGPSSGLANILAGLANCGMAEFDDVLEGVGPRLRALRVERGATLTELAKSTGISVSTLSRLESGQRKPTLELLLPLARAHQVPLDELVDAPETGDPRVRAKPIKRHGRTFIPLTRRPGGLQAFKVIVPPHDPPEPYEPRPRGLRVDLRPLRAAAPRPRQPAPRPQAGRGGRVRHPHPPRHRQPGRPTHRDAGAVRPPGRTDARQVGTLRWPFAAYVPDSPQRPVPGQQLGGNSSPHELKTSGASNPQRTLVAHRAVLHLITQRPFARWNVSGRSSCSSQAYLCQRDLRDPTVFGRFRVPCRVGTRGRGGSEAPCSHPPVGPPRGIPAKENCVEVRDECCCPDGGCLAAGTHPVLGRRCRRPVSARRQARRDQQRLDRLLPDDRRSE